MGMPRVLDKLVHIAEVVFKQYKYNTGDVLYDVVRLRQKRQMLLTSNVERMVTLNETSRLLNCCPELRFTSTVSFSLPTLSNVDTWRRFFGLPDGRFVTTTWQNILSFYNASYGSLITTSAITVSNQARAACPACSDLVGWDRQQSWFSHSTYNQTSGTRGMHFVTNETASAFSVTVDGYFACMTATKLFMFVRNLATGIKIHGYNLADGSLDRILAVSPPTTISMAISPDESRITLLCTYNSWGHLHGNVDTQYLMEIDSTSGAVLLVRTLSESDIHWIFSVGPGAWLTMNGQQIVTVRSW